MGFIEEASDLASSAYEKYLEKGNTKQNFKYSIIDAIRRNGWGTRGNICRDPLRCRVESENNEEVQTIASPERGDSGGLLSDIEQYFSNLKDTDRVIFILRHFWGFSESEIGYCFGVTESRISQRYQGIYERIQKNLSSSGTIKSGNKEEDKQEMARMEPQKRKRISLCETQAMETEESRKMESYNEASFDEWLT